MANTLKATVFRDSERSFLEMLNTHDIKYNRHTQLSDVVMASGITIDILIALSGGWGVLAVACLAWVHARKSRRINVTTNDMRAVWLEGYSAEEAAKILESAKQFAAIDTKPAEGGAADKVGEVDPK